MKDSRDAENKHLEEDRFDSNFDSNATNLYKIDNYGTNPKSAHFIRALRRFWHMVWTG